MSEVAVVGSGRSGLLCAEGLARQGLKTLLIERLPAAGGQEPEPHIGRLARQVRDAGVRFKLGTTAVRWRAGQLETLGVDGAEREPFGVLVVATGTRPATRAELGISGDRCAGVVPGSVALHIVASGVLLGKSPLVLGGGQLAAECASLLLRAGSHRMTVVAPDGVRCAFPAGVELHSGWMVRSVHGKGRVSAVTLSAPGETLVCDAVILAHERRPARNIEGAVFAGEGVVFCQSTADPKSESDARRVAEAAAAEARKVLSTRAAGRREPESVAMSEV
jgi:D-hydroxyproline dehydrogenase subunit alpha